MAVRPLDGFTPDTRGVVNTPSERLSDTWTQTAPGVWEMRVWLESDWWLEQGDKAENYAPEILVPELPSTWSASMTLWWDRDRWRIAVTVPAETYRSLADVVTHTIDFPHPSFELAKLVASDALDHLYAQDVRAYRAGLESGEPNGSNPGTTA